MKKKQKMSERDVTALAKYEKDLDQATQVGVIGSLSDGLLTSSRPTLPQMSI